MRQVTEQGDNIRRSVEPDAVLRHSYRAISVHDANQKNYDFHGWGVWNSHGYEDVFFTAEEEAEQLRYLEWRELR